MNDRSKPDPLFDARPGRRQVRSFVLREGRLTPAQARALEALWPRYGIPNAATGLDLAALFGRRAPVLLEIGFGDGEALALAAAAAPDTDFLGVEVHRPGIGALLNRLDRDGLDNVRVLCSDALQVLAQRIPPGSLAGIRLFFPDPWPKKRHHKRRLVQPRFLDLAARALAPGARLHMATDWAPYAEHMLACSTAHGAFRNLAQDGPWVPRPPWRPMTRFERRGERRGHRVFDLMFERMAGPAAP